MSASLVFEQSYGGVEGDSARRRAVRPVSALAGAPVKQSLAITGSVNQYGVAQPIGGVNQKIEGFFDSAARGLTGDQGVIIPASNVENLMLREDVVDAVAAGRFAVYAIENVDQGIAILTLGDRRASAAPTAAHPTGTLNHRVEERLLEYAEHARRFGAAAAPRGPRRGGPQ